MTGIKPSGVAREKRWSVWREGKTETRLSRDSIQRRAVIGRQPVSLFVQQAHARHDRFQRIALSGKFELCR